MALAARTVVPVAETTLLERGASGDAEAFDVLIRPRLDRMFRMALAITRNESDARDGVQEACVLAWRELPSLRNPARFDAWLNQILVNACRGVLRVRKRRQVREVPAEAAELTGGQPWDLSARHPDAVEQAGEVDAIRRAFDRLDPTTRSLLVLHYVEGKPLGEIARALGSPVGTVKWRLFRARQIFDKALETERR